MENNENIDNQLPRVNSLLDKGLSKKRPSQLPTPQNLFNVDIENEIEGMGVLENGIPYLTSSGLAKLCGVTSRAIRGIAEDWNNEKHNQRGKEIQNILDDQNYTEEEITIPVVLNGSKHNVFPDAVCMAILEYYAFISKENKDIAKQNYRYLARISFRMYVYDSRKLKQEILIIC